MFDENLLKKFALLKAINEDDGVTLAGIDLKFKTGAIKGVFGGNLSAQEVLGLSEINKEFGDAISPIIDEYCRKYALKIKEFYDEILEHKEEFAFFVFANGYDYDDFFPEDEDSSQYDAVIEIGGKRKVDIDPKKYTKEDIEKIDDVIEQLERFIDIFGSDLDQ